MYIETCETEKKKKTKHSSSSVFTKAKYNLEVRIKEQMSTFYIFFSEIIVHEYHRNCFK